MENPKIQLIKTVYFYLVSFVTLMIMVVSLSNLINTILKTYVFKKANYPYTYPASPACDLNVKNADPNIKPLTPEQCAKEQETMKKQNEENRIADLERSIANDISFILVALPLFILHWRAARRKTE